MDANGTRIYPSPTGSHTPDLSQKQDADFSPCSGGFVDDFYICSICGRPVDEDGNDAVYHEPTGSHTLTMIPEKEPTYEEDGYRSHWYCQVCGLLFSDAAGTMPIENEDELILPKLTDNPDESQQVIITSGEKAGEIEILPCTPEPDGLRVRFTSLSPVCITYQEKAAPVQAGDTSCTALWAALLLVSASALALLLLKQKSRTF